MCRNAAQFGQVLQLSRQSNVRTCLVLPVEVEWILCNKQFQASPTKDRAPHRRDCCWALFGCSRSLLAHPDQVTISAELRCVQGTCPWSLQQDSFCCKSHMFAPWYMECGWMCASWCMLLCDWAMCELVLLLGPHFD